MTLVAHVIIGIAAVVLFASALIAAPANSTAALPPT